MVNISTKYIDLIDWMLFNVNFSNISVISWREQILDQLIHLYMWIVDLFIHREQVPVIELGGHNLTLTLVVNNTGIPVLRPPSSIEPNK